MHEHIVEMRAGVKLEMKKAVAMATLRLLLILDENMKKIVSVPDDVDVKRLKELAASTFRGHWSKML